MAEKAPDDVRGTSEVSKHTTPTAAARGLGAADGTDEKAPLVVADLREAVEEKLDDLFSAFDEDEGDEPTVTVLEEGAEITLPKAAPAFDADRFKPPAPAAPRIAPAKPPAESKTVEHPAAPATAPPPEPPKITDGQGRIKRAAAPRKPVSARPPKVKTPVTAQARKTGKPRATPHLGRILLWGAVLGIVVCTVVYFKTYVPTAPAKSTAESGMLFHKVAPATAPAAARIAIPSAPGAAPATAAMPAPAGGAPATAAPAAVSAYVERSYPWAIHMASYRDPDIAQEKEAEFRRGIQSFLVYTDLGDKGVWYRLYFGHFPDATSAVDAVKKYNLKDAVVGSVRYACLTGSYASGEDAAAASQRLRAKGFLPYTIARNGTHHVMVGAHPTMNGVETVREEMLKAGFQGRVIKR